MLKSWPFSIISKRYFLKSPILWPLLCFLLRSVFYVVICVCGHRTGSVHTHKNKLVGNDGTCSPLTAEPAGKHWPRCCPADCKASQPAQLACWERLRYCVTSFGDAGNTTEEPWTTSFIRCQGHDLTDLWLCLTHSLNHLRSENNKNQSQLTSTAGNYCCWMSAMIATEFVIEWPL